MPQNPLPKAPALAAGIALLAMAGVAPFGLLPIEALRLAGPDAVVALMADQLPRVRGAILAWMVVAALDIVVAWGLYRSFSAGAEGLARLSGWFRLAYATLLAAMVPHILEALRLVEASTDPSLGPAIIAALNRFHGGFELVLMLFALHLLLLGAAMICNARAPRWIAVLILLAGAGYLTDAVGHVMVPGYSLTLALYVFIGEVILAIWLVWTALRRA